MPGTRSRGTDFPGVAGLADRDVSAPAVSEHPPCHPSCRPSCGTADRGGSGGDEPGRDNGSSGPGGPQTLQDYLPATRNRCGPDRNDPPRQTKEQGATLPTDQPGWTGAGFARTSRRCLKLSDWPLRGKGITTGNSGALCQGRRPIAQSEERRTRLAEVVGSNPAGLTRSARIKTLPPSAFAAHTDPNKERALRTMAKRRNRRRRKARHGRTTLAQHKRFKKTLKPPLMAMADRVSVESGSWLHERMPEMLWAALIFTKCKDAAFSYFKHLFQFIADHPQRDQLGELTLSGFAEIAEPLRTEFFEYILRSDAPREALRELLRYESLPIREQWEIYLDPPQDLELLLTAVQSVSWHQSESSTACRWVRVMGLIAAGRMYFNHRTSETAKLIVNYPDGDLHQARPSIRATEQGLQTLAPESKRTWD